MIPSPTIPDQPGPPPLNIGRRTFVKRAILSRLAPLTGTRATGTALVQATGGAVTIPASTYGVPILASSAPGSGQGQLDYGRLIKVTADTLVDPVADPSGTAVPIFAQLGGAFYNGSAPGGGVDLATMIQWSPPIPGIEPTSAVSSAMTGGTDVCSLLVEGVPTAFAAPVRRLVLFDRMGLGNLALKGGPNLPAELLRAKLGDFPAGILALMGTRKSEFGQRRQPIHEFQWRLHIVTSRVDATEERYADGDTILDLAAGLIERSGEVDGQAFSLPRVEIGQTRLLVADDGSFVHIMDFTSYSPFDAIERIAPPLWAETEATLVTPTDAEHPDEDDALDVAGPLNWTHP